MNGMLKVSVERKRHQCIKKQNWIGRVDQIYVIIAVKKIHG